MLTYKETVLKKKSEVDNVSDGIQRKKTVSLTRILPSIQP